MPVEVKGLVEVQKALKKLALDRLKDKYMSEWNKAIKELQSKVNTASETLNLYLMGEISEWDLRRNL